MDNINDLLFKFKEHLKVLNRSTATIRAYEDHIRPFLSGICEQDMKKVTKGMVQDYIESLYNYRDKNNCPYHINTICTKVRSIKRYFEFLADLNIIFIDPCEQIKEPKQKKTLQKTALTPEEADQILAQPNLGTWLGIRDRAIMEVFYSTGIRLKELISLTIYDADLTGQMLRIDHGKGKKDRIVPMGKIATKFLKEYITKVRPKCCNKNKISRFLFVNRVGRPLKKSIVQIMIKKYARSAKIKKPVSPHIFRHTFACALIKNGADIISVQKMMGHAYLKTTCIYIKSLGIDLKSTHKKTHPREKDKEKSQVIKPQIKRIMPQDELK